MNVVILALETSYLRELHADPQYEIQGPTLSRAHKQKIPDPAVSRD